ncbi:MAG: dTMP kinase [Actinomycetia bacterium]|nr:dTMP kinase [Actinomycetes bacterium]
MQDGQAGSHNRYIAFEGIEGAGKSTVAARIADHLTAAGESVVVVREPGGTEVGEHIREILLGGDHAPVAMAEAALFAAARAQLIAEKVTPALDSGSWVLSDRSVYSSLAYQAAGRGLDLEDIRKLNDVALGGIWPQVVVLLRLDAGTGLARQAVGDRIGDEPREFHTTVAEAFDMLAEQDPDRFVVIDAAADPLDVVGQVLDALGVER